MKYILIFVGVIFLVSCNSNYKKKEEKANKLFSEDSAGSKSGSSSDNILDERVWDIPALLCLNIDNLVTLYKDSSNVTIDSISLNKQKNAPTKEFAFTKGTKHTMYVTINIRDRKIAYFFIDAMESQYFSADGATADYEDLLKLCDLEMTGKNYHVEPVEALHTKNRYIGINIVPNCP